MLRHMRTKLGYSNNFFASGNFAGSSKGLERSIISRNSEPLCSLREFRRCRCKSKSLSPTHWIPRIYIMSAPSPVSKGNGYLIHQHFIWDILWNSLQLDLAMGKVQTAGPSLSVKSMLLNALFHWNKLSDLLLVHLLLTIWKNTGGGLGSCSSTGRPCTGCGPSCMFISKPPYISYKKDKWLHCFFLFLEYWSFKITLTKLMAISFQLLWCH